MWENKEKGVEVCVWLKSQYNRFMKREENEAAPEDNEAEKTLIAARVSEIKSIDKAKELDELLAIFKKAMLVVEHDLGSSSLDEYKVQVEELQKQLNPDAARSSGGQVNNSGANCNILTGTNFGGMHQGK